MFQIEPGQHGNILPPLPQGRNADLHHVQAVEQVLPEGALGHLLLQVPVGGGDDAHIHLNVPQAAHPLEAPVLQKGQQLGLHGQGQLANLVQEHGSPVGQLHQALFSLIGPGKGPLFIAEELRLQQCVGDGAAVDLHQRGLPPGTAVVDGVDHHPLARSRLSADKQVHVVVLGQDLHIAADAADGLALSHDLAGLLAHQLQAAPPLQLVQAAVDDKVHLFQIEGLLDVVAGPPLHCLHRLGHGAVGGDHDDLDVLIQLFKVLDVVQA